MEILLTESGCDPNILDFRQEYSLLTYCHMQKKHQAFNLILEHAESIKLEPNFVNKIDGTTSYGTLFYHSLLDYYTKEKYRPKEHLELLLEKCQNIDFH